MGVKLKAANGGGSVELDVPSTVNSDLALTVPATAGEIAVKASDGSVDLGGGAALGAPGSNVLTFSTNSAERMRIDSSGRMAIGSTTVGTTSAQQLTVSSSSNTGITIRSGSSNTSTLMFADGTTGSASYRSEISYAHSTDHMAFTTNGGFERMRIHSGGEVTKPSQPGFSASDTRGWNTQTNTTLVFNSPTWNTGIHYSTSTGRFTAPVAGKYLVMCNMYMDNSSGNYNTGTLFKVNGNTYSPAGSAAPYQQVSTGGGVSGDTTNGWTDIINLGVNDYIEWVANGSIKYYMKHCTIGAYLLG